MANFILMAFPLRVYSTPSMYYFTNSYVFRYLTSSLFFFFFYLLLSFPPSLIYSYYHSSTLFLSTSHYSPPPPTPLPSSTPTQHFSFHPNPSQLISFHLISQVLTHGLLSRTLSPLVRVTGIAMITSTTARERGVKK